METFSFRTVEYKDLSGDFALVDVRSPIEYEEFTIPGAVNVPLFDNEERKTIGTVYNHESIEKAKSLGVEYASRRLPEIYAKIDDISSKHDTVVIFCERGGMRSSSLCSLFNSVGMPVIKLRGGYKGYRSYVNEMLPKLNAETEYVVIHGHTGTGKTELLKMLEEGGLSVLDLEKAANHRGSLLGSVGLGNMASQKQFEASVLDKLSRLDRSQVFVEAESSRIGNIVVPHYIMQNMKAGRHILLESSIEARVSRIIEEYVRDENSKSEIIDSLEKLSKHISRENIDRYVSLVKAGEYGAVTEELIVKYYDPMYSNEQKGFVYDLVVNEDKLEYAHEKIIKWLETAGKE